jgi:hypothetical protein
VGYAHENKSGPCPNVQSGRGLTAHLCNFFALMQPYNKAFADMCEGLQVELAQSQCEGLHVRELTERKEEKRGESVYFIKENWCDVQRNSNGVSCCINYSYLLTG